MFFTLKLHANGRNKSKHGWANNVGSCCIYPCWQLFTNRCNNSQKCWDMQCIVGRIQPIRLWRPCVMMHVCGSNNVGKAVQKDPTLLRYALGITQQEKCWELLAQMFDWHLFCTTTPNNMQQGVQMDTIIVTSNNALGVMLANITLLPFAGGLRGCNNIKQHSNLHSSKLCVQTLSTYPTWAVGVWYLSHALKLYVFCCVSSWSTHVLCLYSPGIKAEPFLDGSAFFFLPAFLNPYVVLTGLPCNSWTKSFKSYAPGIGVS